MSAIILVDGVKETINELRRLDPELRKAFDKNVREIAKPIISAAQSRYKSTVFPSGTARPWQQRGREKFPLNGAKAARGVTAKVSTSKKQASTISVVQSNAAAAIFEFAKGGNLGAAFNAKNGAPARVMWPAAEASQSKVSEEMARYVKEVSDQITRNLL